MAGLDNLRGPKVLSLGMSRTGTASMKAALQMLGYPRVHHAYELYVHPPQCHDWLRAWRMKTVGEDSLTKASFWNGVLGNYDAVTDMPSVCFAQELIEAYPNAKVILTVREESGWYQSFNKGVIETYWDNCGLTGALSVFDQKLMRPIHLLWTKLFAEADGYFGSSTRKQMQTRSMERYRWHNDMVVRSVESSRLLIFDMADRWPPLCEFLGLPVPSAPFPRVNKASAVKEVVAAFMRRSLVRVLRNLSVVIGTIAVIAYSIFSR